MKNIKHITTEKNLLDAGATLIDTSPDAKYKIYEILNTTYLIKDKKVILHFEDYSQQEERRLNHQGREDLI